jgi:hypothetical protein
MNLDLTEGVIQALPHPTTKPEVWSAVHRGLQDGSLYQTGGVIRQAAPFGERGRIFAHVYQNGIAGNQGLVDWGPRISSSMEAVQGLLTVTTVLSAVNLGVSVAGFAIMARKIDHLNQSIKTLEACTKEGFQSVIGRLDRLQLQLTGLACLVEGVSSKLDLQSDRLRAQIDWTVVARLHASAESLRDLEMGRKAGLDAGQHAERLRECRIYLAGAVSEALSMVDGTVEPGPDLLRARLLTLAWAQAMVAEAHAWRLAGETASGAEMLQATADQFQDRARRIAQALVGGDAAVLGAPVARQRLSGRTGALLPAFLLQQPWSSRRELESLLASRWAVYLGENPARARANARSGQDRDRWLVEAEAAAFPLAEAARVVDGLRLEYQALADTGVDRKDWELEQVKGDALAIYVRAPLTGKVSHG